MIKGLLRHQKTRSHTISGRVKLYSPHFSVTPTLWPELLQDTFIQNSQAADKNACRLLD